MMYVKHHIQAGRGGGIPPLPLKLFCTVIITIINDTVV